MQQLKRFICQPKYMNRLFSLLIMIGCCSIIRSCDKDSMCSSNKFTEALHASNVSLVSKEVQGLLKQYSESNLNSFASSLTSKYQVKATVLRFDCVQTNPEQTEIKIQYDFQGGQQQRILDVSKDHANMMKLVSIHE